MSYTFDPLERIVTSILSGEQKSPLMIKILPDLDLKTVKTHIDLVTINSAAALMIL